MAASKLLVPNMNSTAHTDYNMQISQHIGADYRTTYKKSHAWIPPFAQEFDNRVIKKITPIKELILKDGYYKSEYSSNFPIHASSKDSNQFSKAPQCDTVQYMTSFEQKIFRNPPRPIDVPTTEIRSKYTMKKADPGERIVFPPNPYNFCPMRAFGRDEQPPLRPDEPGFMKHLDIYQTTSHTNFLPYDERAQRGIACKDIVTFYDASGVPRGGKGYGPRKDTKIEGLCRTKKPIITKREKRCRSENAMQTIPHRAFKSEYNERFQPQSKYNVEPYGGLQAVGTFPIVTRQSPWQNLAAPSMYCTEYCHIGTGCPINAAVETTSVRKTFKHNIGCKCIS